MANYSFKYSYVDFPKWTDSAEGMEIIEGDLNYLRVDCPADVTYRRKDNKDLHIRFMFPENSVEARYPLIMHVKGSAWMKQNLQGNFGDYYSIVRSGFAVAIIEYRDAPYSRFPSQILDLKTAARYIKKHAGEYPIDMNNVFLAGDSSGGHTAVLGFLTWNTTYLDNEDEPEELPALKGLMDFYGVTDIKDLCSRETGLSQEDNHFLSLNLFAKPIDEYPEQYEQASAFTYINLRKELEPVLIIHGNKDRLVPLSHSTDFFKALKNRGTEAYMVMVNNADHGHSFFWNEETKHRIIRFLKEHTA